MSGDYCDVCGRFVHMDVERHHCEGPKPRQLRDKIAELNKVLALREDGLLGPTPEHRALIRERIATLQSELDAAMSAAAPAADEGMPPPA